jgi:hypothetical protein
MEGIEILSAIALIVGVLILAGFYNICRRVSQIRDDQHAVRLMLEEELKRAARDRYQTKPPLAQK